MPINDEIRRQRLILKATGFDKPPKNGVPTDQQAGLPEPPVQKPYPNDSTIIELPPPDRHLGALPTFDAIAHRESRRKYSAKSITLAQLSFLLWATQGIRKKLVVEGATKYRRMSPSAGARHPFETYIAVERVDDLAPGLYRYLNLEHRLAQLRAETGLAEKVGKASCEQVWMRDGAVVFVWTALPYRTEWRYGPRSHKVIAIDVGHLCQNLYIACETLGLGTCAVAAYVQEQVDTLLGVDGEEEFTVYLAPVGQID